MTRPRRHLPYLLAPDDPSAAFPDVREALAEPDGLLAIGGDLSIARLVNAYRHGIFPWFSAGDPILWWSPDPRTVLRPRGLRVSRSLRKVLRRRRLGVTMDRDFPGVIKACAGPRVDGGGTWLVPEMISAYRALHVRGIAHSVEVWQDGALAGGLYGVAIGGIFFGESMFTRVDNASKVALVHLCSFLDDHGFALIDCQVLTSHLLSMGAEQIPRERFVALVEQFRDAPTPRGSWDDGDPTYPHPPATTDTEARDA
ncbi:MAG: leucyl/phenylalanyl-tRNA--protein transferase [Thiohalocapsa sp.]|uniref:leucyl/phenylalanyl-tRNA--protein transferase n=1 Tax=Thiohalocapsa sp. TaxID=2497641 RepID=UPI0025D51CAE|nr:leucyl/phenylalanyl-tRNA--protein transferase [Thiohalocapsa sp.]MCG6942577.1 leucyl/phenylalanyl-tRNA--protein transferase [Thiohalocapsa sp.]